MSVNDHPIRNFGDDETDFIGPTGATEWRCKLLLSRASGLTFEEVLHVRAVSYDGAVLLCQEARLNIIKIDAWEAT